MIRFVGYKQWTLLIDTTQDNTEKTLSKALEKPFFLSLMMFNYTHQVGSLMLNCLEQVLLFVYMFVHANLALYNNNYICILNTTNQVKLLNRTYMQYFVIN